MSISNKAGLAPDTPPERRLATSFAALTQRFAADRSGAVAMTFGLMVIPFSMSVGLAVDYGRIVMVKQKTQGILDAAALAAGRAYQQATGNKETAMTEAATATWKAMTLNSKVQVEKREMKVKYQAGEITVTADQWVRTPFMSATAVLPGNSENANAPGDCSKSKWFCSLIQQTATAQVKTSQFNGEDRIEMAVMVDVTGSMSWVANGSPSGYTTTKIEELRSAAQSLVDIILPANTTSPHKVSLIPFSDAVYADDSIAEAAAGTTNSCSDATWNSAQSKYTGTITNAFSTCDRFTYRTRGTSSDAWRNWATSSYRKGCMIARYGASGTDATTDASPSVTKVDKYYGSACSVKSHGGDKNKLVPLTSDRSVLSTRISDLTAAGGTGGHIGTAWAWYTLSPKWKTVFTGASQPAEYGTPKVKKIAVLMTDGAYTVSHCKGVVGSNIQSSSGTATCDTTYGSVYEPRISSWYTVETGGTKNSSARAAEICTAMKNADITVYTVGFDLGTDVAAKNMLKACATSDKHFYDVSNGDQIKMAFQDIALKATALRLSQ